MVKIGLVMHRRVVESVCIHLVDDGVVLDEEVVVGILLPGLLFGGSFVLLNLPLHLVHDLEALVDLGGVALSVHALYKAQLTGRLGTEHLPHLGVVRLWLLHAVVVR